MKNRMRCRTSPRALIVTVIALTVLLGTGFSPAAERLPDSEPLLPGAGDLQAQRKQIFDYFQNQITAAREGRDKSWIPDYSSATAYERSMTGKRTRLRKMLGLIEGVRKGGEAKVEKLGESNGFTIERVTIPITDGLAARGLVFSPRSRESNRR